MGPRVSSLIFESGSLFASDHQAINYEKHIEYGRYALLNLGLSRHFQVSSLHFVHTLCATLFVPLEKEHSYLGVPLTSDKLYEMEPYSNPVLEGWIDRNLGREPVVAGLEYTPELIISLKGPFFLGLGLVANYSNGVVAQGKFKVIGQAETIYGAAIQHFSKLGISVRFGWER